MILFPTIQQGTVQHKRHGLLEFNGVMVYPDTSFKLDLSPILQCVVCKYPYVQKYAYIVTTTMPKGSCEA